MGELHHMERWETGPEAVPIPQPDQSEKGALPRDFVTLDSRKIYFPLFSASKYPFLIHLHAFGFIFQAKAFCDVDENKIQKGFYTYEESKVISTSAVTNYSKLILIQCFYDFYEVVICVFSLSLCECPSSKNLSQKSQLCTTSPPPPPSLSALNW